MDSNIKILVALKFQSFTSKSFPRTIDASTNFSQLIFGILKDYDISSFDPTYFEVSLKDSENERLSITDNIAAYKDKDFIPTIYLIINSDEIAELNASIVDKKLLFCDIPINKATTCRDSIGFCELLYGIATPRHQYQLIERDQDGKILRRCLPSERLQAVIKRKQFNSLYITKKRVTKLQGRSLTFTGLKDFVKEYHESPNQVNSPDDSDNIEEFSYPYSLDTNRMPRYENGHSRIEYSGDDDSRSRSRRRPESGDIYRRGRNSSFDSVMPRQLSRSKGDTTTCSSCQDETNTILDHTLKRSPSEVPVNFDDTNLKRNRRKLPQLPIAAGSKVADNEETPSVPEELRLILEKDKLSHNSPRNKLTYTERKSNTSKKPIYESYNTKQSKHCSPRGIDRSGKENNWRKSQSPCISKRNNENTLDRGIQKSSRNNQEYHKSYYDPAYESSDIDSPQLPRKQGQINESIRRFEDKRSQDNVFQEINSSPSVHRKQYNLNVNTNQTPRNEQKDSSRKQNRSESYNNLNSLKYFDSPRSIKYKSEAETNSREVEEVFGSDKTSDRDIRDIRRVGSSASNVIRAANRDSAKISTSNEGRSKSSASNVIDQRYYEYDTNRPNTRFKANEYKRESGRQHDYPRYAKDNHKLLGQNQRDWHTSHHRESSRSSRGTPRVRNDVPSRETDKQEPWRSAPQTNRLSNSHQSHEDVGNDSDTSDTVNATSLKRWASEDTVPEPRVIKENRLAKQEFLRKRSSVKKRSSAPIQDTSAILSISTSGYMSAHPSLSSVSSNISPNCMVQVSTQTDIDPIQPAAKVRRNKDYPSLYELLSVCQIHRINITRTSKWDSLGIHCFEAQLEESKDADNNIHTEALSPGGKRLLIGKRAEGTAFKQINPQKMEKIKSVVCMDIMGSNSAASRDGRLRTGDIFVEINGIPVLPYSPQQIDLLLQSYTELDLSIARYNKTTAASRRYSLDQSSTLLHNPDMQTSYHDTQEILNNYQALKEKYSRLKQMNHSKDRIISQLKDMVCKKVEIKKVSQDNHFKNPAVVKNTFQAI